MAARAEVGPGSQIIDSVVGPDAKVRFTTLIERRDRTGSERRSLHVPATRNPTWPRSARRRLRRDEERSGG